MLQQKLKLAVLKCQPSLKKCIHMSAVSLINPNNVTEIKIPVPWGHVAGKWWGDLNKRPILALHGWQDNCGTFDPLIELLPDKRPVLAIDSPGHGYSSHLPKGCVYHVEYLLPLVRRIQRHYEWERVSLMSHSLGAEINFLFAATFAESVDFVISFDGIKPSALASQYKRLGKTIDRTIASMAQDIKDNREYSEDKLKEKWIKSVGNSLTPDSVSILLKRGAKCNKETGKYILTRDPRLKELYLYEWHPELLETLASNIQCHYLLFKFNKSPFFDMSIKGSPKLLEILRKSTKSLVLHVVNGTHHAHLNSPELVAPHIIKFLEHL